MKTPSKAGVNDYFCTNATTKIFVIHAKVGQALKNGFDKNNPND
jgi:hypothetical protein